MTCNLRERRQSESGRLLRVRLAVEFHATTDEEKADHSINAVERDDPTDILWLQGRCWLVVTLTDWPILLLSAGL